MCLKFLLVRGPPTPPVLALAQVQEAQHPLDTDGGWGRRVGIVRGFAAPPRKALLRLAAPVDRPRDLAVSPSGFQPATTYDALPTHYGGSWAVTYRHGGYWNA